MDPQNTVLIHISDLHYTGDQYAWADFVPQGRLNSKRVLGFWNYKLFRKKHFAIELRERLIDQISNSHWDYLLISGDITLMATEHDFKEARKRLEPILKPGRTYITAGNHDCYVHEAVHKDRIRYYFGDCLDYKTEDPVNYRELNDQVVLYEIPMAVPRRLFSARGRVLSDLAKISSYMKEQHPDKTKIVMGHYPIFLPEGIRENAHHRLAGRKRMRDFLLENGVRLYLHGHLHKSWSFSPQENAPLEIVNSGGCCRYSDGMWSGYHQITLGVDKTVVERLRIELD